MLKNIYIYLLRVQVSATDADDDMNGKVLYFLSQEAHGAFTVDENTGVITTSATLDREKTSSYSFQVYAVDLSPAAPRNSTAQVIKGRYCTLNVVSMIHCSILPITFESSAPNLSVTSSFFRCQSPSSM